MEVIVSGVDMSIFIRWIVVDVSFNVQVVDVVYCFIVIMRYECLLLVVYFSSS